MKFIKRHRCHHIEISQLICRANQLTGFYMTVILAFNVLMYQVFINNFVTKKLKYRGSSEWLSYSQPNIRSMFSDSFRLSLENIDWKKKPDLNFILTVFTGFSVTFRLVVPCKTGFFLCKGGVWWGHYIALRNQMSIYC